MRKSQKVAVVGGTVAVLMAGGIAYASWTTSGTGNGTATATSAVNLTVTQGTGATGLFPTGSRTGTITVTNTNPYAVTLSSLTPANGLVAVDAAHSDCNAASVTADALTGLGAPGDTLAATNGSKTYTVTYHMSNDAIDACQGATFTIPFTAASQSS